MARTPSPAAHEKVLEAAIRLIGERGIEGASMDAIAAEAGVSKTTVYKHWKDKDALCLDVVNRLRLVPPEFRSGDPRRDLLSLLTHLALASRPARLLKILPRIIGYAVANPRFARAMQQSSAGPTEAHLARILDEAIEKGVLRPGLDREIAFSMLLGPVMYSRLTKTSVPVRLPGEIVESFWRMFGTNLAKKPAPSRETAKDKGLIHSLPADPGHFAVYWKQPR